MPTDDDLMSTAALLKDVKTLRWALEWGYRHNEDSIGQARDRMMLRMAFDIHRIAEMLEK